MIMKNTFTVLFVLFGFLIKHFIGTENTVVLILLVLWLLVAEIASGRSDK